MLLVQKKWDRRKPLELRGMPGKVPTHQPVHRKQVQCSVYNQTLRPQKSGANEE